MSNHAIPIETLLEYEPFVRAVLRGLIRDEAEVQDLVQETWVRALDRPPSDSRSPKGWLARVASNLARDSQRRSGARRARELEAARPEASGSLAASERRLRLHQRLVDAVMSLDEPYRGVVILSYYEDLEPAQIAARLKRKPTTVRSQLHRAHGLLRAKLDGEFESRSSWMAVALPMAATPGAGLAGTSPAATAPALLPLHSLGAGSLVIMKEIAVAVLVAAFVGGAVWLLNRDPDPSTSSRDVDVALAHDEQSPEEQSAELQAPKLTDAGDASTREPASAPATDQASMGLQASGRALRIRVVDADGGEPVPFFALEARSNGEQHALVTDVAGDAPWASAPFGELEFRWRDDAVESPIARFGRSLAMGSATDVVVPSISMLPVVEVIDTEPRYSADEQPVGILHVETWEFAEEGEADEHTLVVEVGPTWILEPKLSDGGSLAPDLPLIAVLRRADQESWGIATPVQRAGDAHWARFDARYVMPLAQGFALLLEVRAQDGMWIGRSAVERSTGFVPAPLEIELVACAKVSGRVVNSHGDPIHGRVISVQYAGTEETVQVVTDEAGLYEAPWLQPGFVTAYVADPAFQPFEQQLVLHGGKSHALDIMLQERAGGGTLSGVVESATGTFKRDVFLFVDGFAGTSYWARADPKFESEQGVWRARFSIEDVPPGRFRLTCNTTEPYAIAQPERIVDSPNDTLRFIVADDLPPRRIEIDAVSSTSTSAAAPLAFTLRYAVSGGYTRTVESAGDGPLSVKIPQTSSVTWAIFADGHKPASGDDRVFRGDALTVKLDPGWGAQLQLLEVESLSNLVGVEVFADGVAQGRTDARGELTLELPRAPERIHFDETRWLVHNSGTFQSDLDPTTGALVERKQASSVAVYLRPAR